jgi:hypothetical protein
MVTVHPEYVVDEKRHCKAVLLPASEWQQIVRELEELDDIRAYDAAQSHVADRLPFEQADIMTTAKKKGSRCKTASPCCILRETSSRELPASRSEVTRYRMGQGSSQPLNP